MFNFLILNYCRKNNKIGEWLIFKREEIKYKIRWGNILNYFDSYNKKELVKDKSF